MFLRKEFFKNFLRVTIVAVFLAFISSSSLPAINSAASEVLKVYVKNAARKIREDSGSLLQVDSREFRKHFQLALISKEAKHTFIDEFCSRQGTVIDLEFDADKFWGLEVAKSFVGRGASVILKCMDPSPSFLAQRFPLTTFMDKDISRLRIDLFDAVSGVSIKGGSLKQEIIQPLIFIMVTRPRIQKLLQKEGLHIHDIRTLRIEGTLVPRAWIDTFLSLLRSHCTLRRLDFSPRWINIREEWQVGMDDENGSIMGEVLKKNTTLRVLNLSNNGIRDKGAKAIAEALYLNTTLQALDLSSNEISDEGASSIARTLETNTTLQQLSLHNNKIGPQGGNAIKRTLQTNKELKTLGLSRNVFGDEGVRAIGRGLIENIALEQLDLSSNEIRSQGASFLALALTVNTSLQRLHLSHNKIGSQGAAAIAAVVGVNNPLQELDLSFNEMGDKEARAIAAALITNNTLCNLNLSSNVFGYAGGEAIAHSFRENNTLKHLNISTNIKECLAGFLETAERFVRNSTLQHLEFDDEMASITDIPIDLHDKRRPPSPIFYDSDFEIDVSDVMRDF